MNLKISALEFVQQVQNGNISAEDFVAKTLERIQSIDDKLHAFLFVNEKAIDQARDIDKKIKSGSKVGACFGMPISIKDNMCIKDSKTTCASKMLENFVAPYDATVITKLKEQDAVFVGKVNLDEFAMGLTTEFSAFGSSKNPWNTEYVPGGSSGGSAVSVSAFECVASLGSDTGGSVRNPASFCSVVGYKPTYGLISRYGLISYSNSIEQIGPLTRTVKDTAFMLNIISGLDPNDNTTIDNKNEDYLSGIDSGIEGKKIGIIQEMVGEGTDPTVLSATKDAISKLENLGATCEDVSLDMVKYSVAAYYTIAATEAGSNLARYDNLRYGYDFSVEGYEFNSYIAKARRNFGPEVKRRMIIGGFVPSAGHAGKYFLKAIKVKSKLTREINEAFKKFDLLIAPTVPILPFKIGEKINDPVSLFLIDINTVTANLTGKPSISVPFTISNGLPIGIQLLADSMNDKLLLQAAYALEQTITLQEVPI
ncbi:MAG: Asp-tRNA(Asn)/Glu-tRNA(Gln) amidotransferase subunit GatA [Candidatus Nitrosopumilus sp. MTA1]|uniref:Glutamyl-tRNA(Gln) amidotransferase subunit A n=1 Tax=Marine Group I thaumarchaeote TaxID=2511932 RepID=A0A7K4MI39_9ARCH|nr:MAG: Asp-tRNA(Asn)/Glu-tRNA(Gln) amidotransferase subunit GatA [Nitrosopumilus sp. YT1]NMI82846.1 Asp-tRNA(Asn)/Glu-tRNA(Gln) amidotransferase subunit GatA [Candidatus Nitrosopumilus sp. MTA1]NWJ28844.1 Asp-tRNA(Asn)/Glu-tRNA(Gln) amidotransferase subunit GatA [Marine Group I thaumarchaeote]NWJ57427.1 Asp-tRNA(Asn)/Glu-tRNA(Gln) amidotransferase subunit GatA [Marine Group I thaumarchaeote]NWJ83786.1 Asp-tRNA(Asn)/Glu-tRNA(Gln) amidotransferase subunit GatA [Marine Group I thaumarchaeote]